MYQEGFMWLFPTVSIKCFKVTDEHKTAMYHEWIQHFPIFCIKRPPKKCDEANVPRFISGERPFAPGGKAQMKMIFDNNVCNGSVNN